MSIEREGKFYTLYCDICGESISGFSLFQEAVRYKQENGWKAQAVPDGEWQDLCPECQEGVSDHVRTLRCLRRA